MHRCGAVPNLVRLLASDLDGEALAAASALVALAASEDEATRTPPHVELSGPHHLRASRTDRASPQQRDAAAQRRASLLVSRALPGLLLIKEHALVPLAKFILPALVAATPATAHDDPDETLDGLYRVLTPPPPSRDSLSQRSDSTTSIAGVPAPDADAARVLRTLTLAFAPTDPSESADGRGSNRNLSAYVPNAYDPYPLLPGLVRLASDKSSLEEHAAVAALVLG
jgi:hypothetical protein